MIPLCIGHRGAPVGAPENTILSFKRAFAAGADGVELDVHVTRDGIPAVFHDGSLRRLTGARGRIARCTLSDLAALRVSGQRIPSLAEALKTILPRGLVQVEIKRGVPVPPVLGAIGSKAKGVILASFSPRIVAHAARMAPGIPRMLIADRPRVRGARSSALKLLRVMASAKASGISVDFRAITSREFVDIVHSHGAKLWCWTVDEPADMRRLARWGVDAIISNDPGRLRQVVDGLRGA